MDIKITDSSLRKYLNTRADPDTIAQNVSLCGPTFDRLHKVDGGIVYDIEAITNRIDTASSLGVAREAAVILSQFNIPSELTYDPYKDLPLIRDGKSKQFHLNIEKDLVIRFSAIALERTNVKKSPKITETFLENCGLRPINNLVDITNELTIEYGLPSHVFDLDKLAAQSLTIRESHKGEVVTTLDGLKNNLRGGDIVIEDGTGQLVDLCGIMGGQIAEVDNHTKNILLIVPVYQPKKIRSSSLYLQKRTLAAQIYEKQPDPELTLPLINKAIQLIKERTGGAVSSPLFDHYPSPFKQKFIRLNFNWLNSFVGTQIEKSLVVSILDGLGFSGTIDDDSLVCSVPSWRYHDINIEEDLAEEVARIYGYFRLPGALPQVTNSPEPKSKLLTTELEIKKYLSNIGYHEIYNNSLISEDLINQTLLKPQNHLKLQNALSSDFEYLRLYLGPSLLQNLKHNQGKVDGDLRLFEVSNIYNGNLKALPDEVSMLAAISTQSYPQTKGEIESLFEKLGLPKISFKPNPKSPSYFHDSNTAGIYSGKNLLGYIGQVKPVVLRNLGLNLEPILTELNLQVLIKNLNTGHIYHPVSEYPMVREDITISSSKNIGDIMETIRNSSSLIQEINYLNSYRNNHTFKVSFGSQERNLEQTEINTIKEIIRQRFKI